MQIIKMDEGIDAKLEYEIANIVKAAYDRLPTQYDRAKYISDYLDQKYGGCWRVIIGKQFQSCGTYYLSQLLKITYLNEMIEIIRTQGDSEFEIIQKDANMSDSNIDSIIVIIQNAQQMHKQEMFKQSEYIQQCLESRFNGKWGVITGYDFNCVVPYINYNYLCLARHGTRYTVFMVSK